MPQFLKKFLSSSWEVVEVGVIAFVAVFFIRSFLVQPFLVSGASMEPTFSNGDYLLIDVLTYRFRNPERGEVIVFRYPDNESVFFIKRIIGLPGERIVVRDGAITIYEAGGSELRRISETYLSPDVVTGGEGDITLGADEYFLMGDNRSFSFDSRNWGPAKRREVVGLVRLRILPIIKAQAFQSPAY